MKCGFTWLVFAIFLAIPAALSAQEATEAPIAPLALDVISQGALVGEDNAHTQTSYRFAIPETEDVVIRLEADKVVYGTYCLQTSTSSATTESCTGAGGGGGDYPILIYFYFPTDDNPQTRQFVTLTLVRPLEGIAHYTLTPHLVTPASLTLDQAAEASSEDAAPFQSYTLEADPTQHFTVQAEEADLDGEFLWVAYEPIGENRDGGAFASEASLPSPKYLDSAGSNDDDEGLQGMVLMYLGGDIFRLLVRSDTDYSLHTASVTTITLEANETLPVELSYRQPMQVVRLNSANAGALTLDVTVTVGTGVLGWLYSIEEQFGEFWSIGQPAATPEAPLTRSFELPASISWRTVILQLPAEYTRDTLTVEVSWQPQP